MLTDLRYAARSLRKRPGFTAVAVVTLALGVGANTAIFSVVNSVLLRPLPYAEPERLVTLWAKNDKKGLTGQPAAWPNFVDWRAQSQAFEQLAAVRPESFGLSDWGGASGGGEPERVNGVRVTTNILAALGVQPALGRDFLPEEASPDKASVALVGHGLWQRRYGGDPGLIGRTLALDGKPYTIVGILPAWLKYPGLAIPQTGAEVWIPYVPLPNEMRRSFANTRAVGRLKPDVSLARAQAEMDTIAARLEREYPADNTNVGVGLVPLHEHLTGRVRLALMILLGAVACVLLIACANVASLMLARAAGRRTEVAVRSALGAGRWQLIRQTLVECLLLSFVGGLAGLLLAWAGVGWLMKMNAGAIPRAEEIGVDGRALGFTLLVSLVTGLLCGVVPALRSSRLDLTAALKEGRRGAGGGVEHRRWLGGLVVAEIALALVLLAGAGLLIRSFRLVTEADPGFDPRRLLTLSVPLPLAGYEDQAKQALFYERALERLGALPGVEAAAAVFRVPLVGFASAIFTAEGKPVPPGTEPNADYRTVSVNYFRAAGIRLVKGREFTARDKVDAPDVIIINEELARRFFAGEDPIGKRLQIATERTRFREIVGVVADAKLARLDAKADPAIYVPHAQNTWPHALRTSSIVVRTSGEPLSLSAAVRGELRAIDPSLAVTQVRTMEEIVGDSLAPRRFSAALLAVFAALAGALAAVGIYGVMAYSVAERRHEIGIRMALGARRSEILRMVLVGGGRLAALGVVIGLAGAAALTRLMAGLLYGVGVSDPPTFALAALALAGVALAACLVPARRATKVDPMVALRSE
jgi:putative ABC transport system permease protein